LTEPSFDCLAVLEDEACQLYEVLVDKSEDPGVGLLLDKILMETRMHRDLLKHASKITGQSTTSVAECEKRMGTLFVHSVEFLRSIKNQVLNGMPVAEAAAKLVKFEEDAASEEDLSLVYANVNAAVTTNVAMKRILADIAEDEESHAEILELIVEISNKK
jgi:rubrerythrin